jgi:regulator of protease activity HflC (stomatin/prohibitin superfamily)
MFGFSYLKADPNSFVIHYSNGKVRRQGQGLAFFFFRPSSSIVLVPTASVDAPFIFNELTADYQQMSLQGQLTYRVADPLKLSQNLNFTMGRSGRGYQTDDPLKLGQRVVNLAQVLARPKVQELPLRTALQSSELISAAAIKAIRESEAFRSLGIEVIAFSLLSVKPTPEMARAIEAEAREGLQKRADEAISERRNAAVEQERRIKENELLTEKSVQEKQQGLQRSRLESEISLEKQRESFVAARVENTKKEADAQAYALRASLEPLAKLDPRTLEVLAASKSDPRLVLAMAFRHLAADASKIGQLNITPDLLSSLLSSDAAQPKPPKPPKT